MRNKLLLLLYVILISSGILFFTTKSSILYPFNDWVDANAFFTMGKSMFHGLVPYLDLFEQKGPFLYVIYGIGSLISYKTFTGIFILEVISMSISLIFLYKILRMFLNNKLSLLILPIFCVVLTTSYAFTHGGSAEEFMLPLFMITLYYFFKHFKVTKLKKKEMFLIGILAGLVMLTKYTLLGFWIGFTFAIFMDYLLDGELKKAIGHPFVLLFGMIFITIPFIIYFYVNSAIMAFFDNYFLVNMTSYGEHVTIIGWIKEFIHGFFGSLSHNYIAALLLLASIIFLPKLNINKRCKVLFIVMFLLSIFFVYFGLKFYRYYLLFILFFSSIGLLSISNLLKNIKINDKVYAMTFIAIMIISLFSANFFANNKYFRNVDKKDLFQFQFAEIINSDTDKSMVSMGRVDPGVFTVSGLLPCTYYFEKLNLPYETYPENMDALKSYIHNKTTNYIVYFTKYDQEKLRLVETELFLNYELIKENTQKFENKNFHAYLFKRLN